MISKTIKEYIRRVKSKNYGSSKEYHVERVVKETWWLLWFIPIYSQETIISTNI